MIEEPAQEPEFMWLGQPAVDGAQAGALKLEQFGVSGNNWCVLIDLPGDEELMRRAVTGVRSNIDALTRSWIQSLSELVPK